MFRGETVLRPAVRSDTNGAIEKSLEVNDADSGGLQSSNELIGGQRVTAARTEIMNEIARKPFQLEEATIDEMHAAIRAGEITVVQIVQHYIDRAHDINGVSSWLVTEDGGDVAPMPGTVRAGAPLEFPTTTVPVTDYVPDYDKYQGPPLEFGRMEPTASDPDVYQQFGMVVGIPRAGQVNALATLNIRGERSAVCKGDFDKHPSLGALPPGAPPV